MQAMSRLNAEGPQADARARRTAAAEAREEALRILDPAAADASRDKRLRDTVHQQSSRARKKDKLDKLPGLVKDVNELQQRKTELQTLLKDDVSIIVVETEEVEVVFDKEQTKANEIDSKKRDEAKKKKDAAEVKKITSRISGRRTRTREAAQRAKVADLAKRKAELEAEVKELQARKAVMPGSAVFHS